MQGKKLVDSYDIIDESSENWLIRLDELICNEVFLSGIGGAPPSIPKSLDYPVVSNINDAIKFYASQEIWNLPRPWPFQYYVGEIEEAETLVEMRFKNNGGDLVKMRRVYSPFLKDNRDKNTGIVGGEVFGDHISKRLDAAALEGDGYGRKLFDPDYNEKTDRGALFDLIEYSFLSLIKACLMGGIDQSEFHYRMYQGFLAGGVPCGWLGDLDQANGGKADECMVMYHYGKVE